MKNFIRLLLLVISTFAYSQTTVKGTVTDEKNNPVPQASVVIQSSGVGTTSDENGQYVFTTDATGNQKIKVSLVGYKDQTKTVKLEGSEVSLDFSINENVSSLDEIVLTGTSVKRSQKETPVSVVSFTAKELTKLNTSSQANILRSVPGITTENGGGEVASNVFVRGLPSGGQFQFNPIQIDGMPVLSTFGLNSSAHDVYFRTDIGMKSLEFIRGGSSVLYGAGSVAGIINYTSVTGSATPKNILKTEVGTNSRYKADFLSSGQLGGKDSNLFYALTGFYRYDEGPIKTGLPTEGYQIRGNIKKVMDKSTITFSGQMIDDKVQFFLPYPLVGGSRTRPVGNDGQTINTLQTAAVSDISYATPNGIFTSNIADGVATKGGYFMTNFVHDFSDNLKIDATVRKSNYKHQFNFFTDGSGVAGAKAVETQAQYKAARGITTGNFTTINGAALAANALLYENRIVDRVRPLDELVAEIKITNKMGVHTVTAGSFMSRSSAGDLNITTSYLSEYNNRPGLVNLSGYTVNGVTNTATGYSNKNITSNKLAFFLTDQIKLDKWNFDIGFRHETASGTIENEKTKEYNLAGTPTATGIAGIDKVIWGTGAYQRANVSTNDYAVSLAALYKVSSSLSAYANFSKGYFFPELRSVKFDGLGNPNTYSPEKIIQAEAGIKYGQGKLSGTVALYSANLSDRRNVQFINDPNNAGAFIEKVDLQDTKSYGVETTWNYRFIDGFAFNGTFTYQKHELTKSENNPTFVGNKLARQPNLMTKLGLAYDKSKIDANLDFNYAGDKFTNDANTIELQGFGIVDLSVGYTFTVGSEKESLRIGVQGFNLLNSEGITEGSPRLGDNQTDEQFFVGRPIIPRTGVMNLTLTF
ncbi:TonB-dependent receptor [Frigoriflavimonas asaccharolytica]|uniref:Outer membrane receptor protein involved in Fe transport n=1 Tax=Frigoriflavimonas asaccharolytica TaxID=2735899 RepID=A0A8J8KB26_9FLAO|nr:TonB-dependent receptor [Frigoriflavimonas asaccharolytica]NRS92119.1 outer membrane receptor protein involved in Fe transport [Frigoriflavimonas asaccharolytica]